MCTEGPQNDIKHTKRNKVFDMHIKTTLGSNISIHFAALWPALFELRPFETSVPNDLKMTLNIKGQMYLIYML